MSFSCVYKSHVPCSVDSTNVTLQFHYVTSETVDTIVSICINKMENDRASRVIPCSNEARTEEEMDTLIGSRI